MAFAVTAAKDEPLSGQAPGNRRRVAARLAGDTAYSSGAGGSTLPASLFGLVSIDAVDIGFSTDFTRAGVYDSSTGKLLIFSAFGTEANGDQSAKIFPVVVWGI